VHKIRAKVALAIKLCKVAPNIGRPSEWYLDSRQLSGALKSVAASTFLEDLCTVVAENL
jgi:hypothetical protein